MFAAIFLAIVVSLPQSQAAQCDLIERNHFHDAHGKRVYSQLVFWDYDPARGQHIVRGWKLLSKDRPLDGMVSEAAASGRYRAMFEDPDSKVTREVVSRQFRETYTQVDPERANKAICEECDRHPLFETRPKVSPVPEPIPDPLADAEVPHD